MSTFAKIAYLNALLVQNDNRRRFYALQWFDAQTIADEAAVDARVAGAEARAAELRAELATLTA